MRTLALSLCALLVALPGCANDKDVADAERLLDQARQGLSQHPGWTNGTVEPPRDPEFTMNVTAARIVAGRCHDGYAGFGDECHVLDVTLDLRGSDQDVALGFGWRGITADGVGMRSEGRGETAAAGRIVKAQIRFDLEAGTAERLVELQHTGNWEDRVTTASVPAY